MLNRYSLLILLTLFLSGCAAMGPKFETVSQLESGKALVYVFRPYNQENSGINPGINIDGVTEFVLKNNAYTYLFLDPGKHKVGLILSDDYHGEDALVVDLVEGHTYYLALKTRLNRVGKYIERRFMLNLIYKQEDIKTLEDCRYLAPEKYQKF